jgi:hypothetical protein
MAAELLQAATVSTSIVSDYAGVSEKCRRESLFQLALISV